MREEGGNFTRKLQRYIIQVMIYNILYLIFIKWLHNNILGT